MVGDIKTIDTGLSQLRLYGERYQEADVKDSNTQLFFQAADKL